jgi:hypothetical protein
MSIYSTRAPLFHQISGRITSDGNENKIFEFEIKGGDTTLRSFMDGLEFKISSFATDDEDITSGKKLGLMTLNIAEAKKIFPLSPNIYYENDCGMIFDIRSLNTTSYKLNISLFNVSSSKYVDFLIDIRGVRL